MRKIGTNLRTPIRSSTIAVYEGKEYRDLLSEETRAELERRELRSEIERNFFVKKNGETIGGDNP